MAILEKWVIFDGDNTLWNVEALYDEARQRFCTWAGKFGPEPHEFELYQRARDVELHAIQGYGKDRFAQSFVDSLKHFIPSSTDEQLGIARAMALQVFAAEAEPAGGVDHVLEALGQEYKLAILTAGDAGIQQRRLATFGRQKYFSVVSVVERKNVEVLREFLHVNHISAAETWMVGDSLKSDILPAISIGMRAILVNTDNWKAVEHEGHERPHDAHVVHELAEVPLLLLANR